MELRTVNTFLHIAELHSFSPHRAAAGLLAVGGVLPNRTVGSRTGHPAV